jgi:hypothetical protein
MSERDERISELFARRSQIPASETFTAAVIAVVGWLRFTDAI